MSDANENQETCRTLPGAEAEQAAASPRECRAALYMALAHCQGGHSDAGKVGAAALGIQWPFNMRSLIKAARAEGFNPAALYPWLMSAPYSGGRYFTGFEKSNARRVRGPA